MNLSSSVFQFRTKGVVCIWNTTFTPTIVCLTTYASHGIYRLPCQQRYYVRQVFRYTEVQYVCTCVNRWIHFPFFIGNTRNHYWGAFECWDSYCSLHYWEWFSGVLKWERERPKNLTNNIKYVFLRSLIYQSPSHMHTTCFRFSF